MTTDQPATTDTEVPVRERDEVERVKRIYAQSKHSKELYQRDRRIYEEYQRAQRGDLTAAVK